MIRFSPSKSRHTDFQISTTPLVYSPHPPQTDHPPQLLSLDTTPVLVVVGELPSCTPWHEGFCTRVRFMLMSCKQDICMGFAKALPRVLLLLEWRCSWFWVFVPFISIRLPPPPLSP